MAPMSVPHSVWGKMTPSLVAMPLRYAPPVTTSVWPLTKSLSGLQKR